MAHLYFHCTNADESLIDRRGRTMRNLKQARAYAADVARQVMTAADGLSDFRDWRVHIADEAGEELLLVPFAFVRPTKH